MNLYEITQTLEEFFTHDELRILLRLKLGRDMAAITQAGNFRTQIFEVVTAAKRENWLDDFIEAIKLERPHIEVASETFSMSSKEQEDISRLIALLTGAYGQDGFIQKTEKRLARIEEKIGENSTVAMNTPLMVGLIYFVLGVIVSMGAYVAWTKFFVF